MIEGCRVVGSSLMAKFNERSQEVIENKRDRFIANCKSQEVYENKGVNFCKAKRLLINKHVNAERQDEEQKLHEQ